MMDGSHSHPSYIWNYPYHYHRSLLALHLANLKAQRRHQSAREFRVLRQETATKEFVSIPMHHVEWEEDRSRSNSAVKIQKVLRGFLVRRKEVIEVERRMWWRENTELMRRESKERLKVNEELMRMILKLDTVLGVDCGVRECRKAMALQEMIDAIGADNDNAETGDTEWMDGVDDDDDEMVESVSEGAEIVREEWNVRNRGEDLMEIKKQQPDENEGDEGRSKEEGSGGRGKENGIRELVEKMVEDNEKMKGLMAQLVDRFATHSQLLTILSQRVDQLEK